MELYTIFAGNGYIDLSHPETYDFDILSIARSLSHLCRFTGHTKHHYSVAQHSYYASIWIESDDPNEQFQALMHDATEAFVGDVAAPLKAALPDYRTVEARVEAAVFAHFGLPQHLTPKVQETDLKMLATEVRDLLPVDTTHDFWNWMPEPYPGEIQKWEPEVAEVMFMARFATLEKLCG